MMASKRTSGRAVKSVKYFAKEESSDEEDVDPKMKEAKSKLKEMMADDSDAESDFEKEMIKENKDPQLSSEDEASETEQRIERETLMKNTAGPSNGLQLSDSESSSDEDVKQNRKKMPVGIGASRIDFRSSSLEDNIKSGEEEDVQSSQTLIALAQNLNRIHTVWDKKEAEDISSTVTPQSKKGKSAKKESKGKKSSGKKTEPVDEFSLDSITKLLAKGENVEYGSESDAEDVDVKEEAKEPVVSKEGIQISIDLPDKVRRKKKKGFDMAAFLKRELARARRETQVLLHQSHFLCLVAHLRYLNFVITDETFYGAALSIIPPAHMCSANDLTLARLSTLVRWLREFIPLNKTRVEETVNAPFRVRLLRALESYLAMDLMELVAIFVLICRSLGVDTRIVLNLDVCPLKPPNDEESKPVLKPKAEEKEQTKEKDEKEKKKEVEKEKEREKKEKEKKEKNRGKVQKEKEKKEKEEKEKKKEEKNKKQSKRRKGSDSEGEQDEYEEQKSSKETSSKSLSSKLSQASKRKSSETLSTRLSELSKRKSARKSKSSSDKDREEEMIDNINKKYPSKKEDKVEEVKEEKSRKRKSEDVGETSRAKAKPSKTSKAIPRTVNYWAEVYLERERKWICVDLETGRINSPSEVESRLPKPIFYILSINNMGNIKDVTKRYVGNYMTTTRKIRFEEKWISSTLRKFSDKKTEKESKEDLELEKKAEEAPMPTTVSGFKNHPMYVLQRHLLKFEAIYPADAPPIGWMKSEPVYARECVHTLQGRTSWLKEGRTVRLNEEPYKIVKARPKWDRMTGSMVKDEPLEVFGHWQTELYVPPPAVNGKVPRNEYGNVELFKPWMLPKGCVHIPINGMSRVLRKLNIDAAPAMIGWDFSGGCHPIYDGYVVCEEFADTVMDAWNQEQELKVERAAEKREKRVLDNWRRIVKGLFTRERIQAKYMKNHEPSA